MMSSYWDMFRDNYSRDKPTSPIGGGFGLLFNTLYDSSHGGQRRALSYTPFLGWSRRIQDDIQKAEDYYQNTGEDPLYMSRYGGNAGASPLGALGGLGAVPRMARSLSKLYPAEVKESFNFSQAIQYQNMKRHNLEREMMVSDLYSRNAEKWEKAWKAKYGRD